MRVTDLPASDDYRSMWSDAIELSGRRRGVDLQRAGRVGHRTGEIGGVAGAVLDGRGAEIDRRHRQVGGVLAGRQPCS